MGNKGSTPTTHSQETLEEIDQKSFSSEKPKTPPSREHSIVSDSGQRRALAPPPLRARKEPPMLPPLPSKFKNTGAKPKSVRITTGQQEREDSQETRPLLTVRTNPKPRNLIKDLPGLRTKKPKPEVPSAKITAKRSQPVKICRICKTTTPGTCYACCHKCSSTYRRCLKHSTSSIGCLKCKSEGPCYLHDDIDGLDTFRRRLRE